MEISDTLKKNIKDIQSGLIKCIQNHQSLALKLKEDPAMEQEIKVELSQIQKNIVELNDKQKVLLQQLRKELEENIINGQMPAYNFNLYKVKPGQLESKKRRRKDLSLAPKVVSCRTTLSPPSLSPSPTPSSSSLSDDSIDYVSPVMMPIPVPKARPKLLPNNKDNAILSNVNRRDLKPARVRKNQKQLSDEALFKDIPVYYDPVPSPPPADEKDLKARFMGALALIPKEMLSEILNRKVERKRRSTATNNPNFVYNNDWEIPAVSRYNQWKRSKTYLSPHKASNSKKSKTDDSDAKHSRKDKEADNEKAGRLHVEDGKSSHRSTAEEKSRNSTSNVGTCVICRKSGLMTVCRHCSASYHLSCVSPNSAGCCPKCKRKKSPTDEGSSEDSSKEEFISKCPNVAESYNKLKEYIEHHTDSDTAALFIEREQCKMELIIKNQELYEEKHKLEEKAAELSEALLMQEDSRNELLKEEQRILGKIKTIVDFVKLFQKVKEKKRDKDNVTEKNEMNQQAIQKDSKDENAAIDAENVEKEAINSCHSPAPSSKESIENYRNQSDSPHLSGESSLKNELNCGSPSFLLKESLFVDNINIEIIETSASPTSVASRDSASNPLFELEEGDDQFTSQSIDKSSAESYVVEYENPNSEPEFY